MSGDVTSLPDSSPLLDSHERPESLLDADADADTNTNADTDTGEAAGPRSDGHDPSNRGQRHVGYRALTRGDPADLAAAAARLLRQARPLHE